MSVWGDQETEYFYELTPNTILDAVEDSTGLRCTGRVMALNSMENRVYEIELEPPYETPRDRFLICKFYRPGRWTKEMILEEHQFLKELEDEEVPAVGPKPFKDGSTLHERLGLFYTIFPKFAGRAPDELSDEQLPSIGRLIARMHNVGASKPAKHRLELNPHIYGLDNLKYLLESNSLPPHLKSRYEKVVQEICEIGLKRFQNVPLHRIHGDCHLGNLLQGRDGLFFVDFDDMVIGPAVQDLWLAVPGRDEYAQAQLSRIVESYQMMRPFNRSWLQLIELLRALRFVHFSAWIARRWQDAAFPRAFPHFGTERYWQEQIRDLEEQLALLQNGS